MSEVFRPHPPTKIGKNDVPSVHEGHPCVPAVRLLSGRHSWKCLTQLGGEVSAAWNILVRPGKIRQGHQGISASGPTIPPSSYVKGRVRGWSADIIREMFETGPELEQLFKDKGRYGSEKPPIKANTLRTP